MIQRTADIFPTGTYFTSVTPVDLTDTPDDVRDAGEQPPDFDAWADPADVLKGDL